MTFRRVPGFVAAAMCLALAMGCGTAQPFVSELGLTFQTKPDSDVGSDPLFLDGTVFLRPVGPTEGPVDQAAFVSRAPYMSVTWQRLDGDAQAVTEYKMAYARISGRGFPIFTEVAALHSEYDEVTGPVTSMVEQDTLRLAAGLFLGSGFEVKGTYDVSKNDSPSLWWCEARILRILGKILHVTESGAAIAVEGSYGYSWYDEPAPVNETWTYSDYGAAATWYPYATFGVGGSWHYWLFSGSTGLGAHLVWNLPPGHTVRLEFGEDGGDSTYALGVVLRM